MPAQQRLGTNEERTPVLFGKGSACRSEQRAVSVPVDRALALPSRRPGAGGSHEAADGVLRRPPEWGLLMAAGRDFEMAIDTGKRGGDRSRRRVCALRRRGLFDEERSDVNEGMGRCAVHRSQARYQDAGGRKQEDAMQGRFSRSLRVLTLALMLLVSRV